MLRKCSKCKIVKELTEFHRDRSKSTGYYSQCKDCYNRARRVSDDKRTIIKSNKPQCDEGFRFCTKCETVKNITEFARNKSKKSGYSSQCKECLNSSSRKNPIKPECDEGFNYCIQCKTIKLIEKFVKDKNYLSGYSSRCKDCKNHSRRVSDDKRTIIKSNKPQCDEGFRFCTKCKIVKEITKFAKNRSKSSGLDCWCLQCKSKHRNRTTEYASRKNESYRQKKRVWNNARRAKKKNCKELGLTSEQWLNTLNELNHKCMNCGSSENIHQDHFIPLHKNGKHTVTNVIPLCAHCNQTKSNKMPEEFFSKEKYVVIVAYLMRKRGLWLG